MAVSFFVPGIPQPQGSTRAFKLRTGKVIVTSANKRLRPWRLEVKEKATEAWGDRETENGPVSVTLHFYFPRPLGHFGKKGVLKSAPLSMTVRPDVDKLIRGALDALKESGVYRDDSQVTGILATKGYENRPLFCAGLHVVIGSQVANRVDPLKCAV